MAPTLASVEKSFVSSQIPPAVHSNSAMRDTMRITHIMGWVRQSALHNANLLKTKRNLKSVNDIPNR